MNHMKRYRREMRRTVLGFLVMGMSFMLLFVCGTAAGGSTAKPILGAEEVRRILEGWSGTRGIGGVVPLGEDLISFKYDSAELLPQSFVQLDAIGKALEEIVADESNAQFEIGGYTDSRGGVQYNLELGWRRAESVRNYLVGKWPSLKDHLAVKSYGESSPVIRNAHTELEYAANRRVEIRLIGSPVNAPASAETETPPEDSEPPSAPTERPGGFGVVFGAFRLDASGGRPEAIVSGKTVLHSGDRVQLYLRPLSNCFAYVYAKDSRGKGSWLFPGNIPGMSNPLIAGTDYWLPARNKAYTLDNDRGTEDIFLVISPSHETDLDALCSAAAGAEHGEVKTGDTQGEQRRKATLIIRTIQGRGVAGVEPWNPSQSGAGNRPEVGTKDTVPAQQPATAVLLTSVEKTTGVTGGGISQVNPTPRKSPVAHAQAAKSFRYELTFQHR